MRKNKQFIWTVSLISLIVTISSCTTEAPPPDPIGPLPTARQLNWHKMEMNAFIHFTTNTFTDKEWGFGDESPDIFNPIDFNADAMIESLSEAGFKGVILTCKHHDGFCLWPSAFTEHSVKNSPYKDGKGNIVEEVYQACKNHGLKFGVYLSPWDRNRADYGQASYVDYYRNQLKELFKSYHPVFEMWFDGANGGDGYYGGANEARNIDGENYYDWPTTLKIVRDMEPEVIFFSDAGPDIRWVGNERGVAGETNWNSITTDTLYAGKPGITGLLNSGSEDGESWIPAEVDVSIRPGWFYHASEDQKVKTPDELFEIYLSSVGRGSNLLLNIPPDRTGNFHKNDVESLIEWKKKIDQTFEINLASEAKVKASNVRGSMRSKIYSANNITDGNPETYWSTDDELRTAYFEIDLKNTQKINYIVLQEYIQLGQRIKHFKVEAEIDDSWVEIATGTTTIGYKRILRTKALETSKIRISIIDSKACPLISNVEVY